MCVCVYQEVLQGGKNVRSYFFPLCQRKVEHNIFHSLVLTIFALFASFLLRPSHMHIHTSMHTHTHTPMHTRTHTHIHAYSCTHTRSPSLSHSLSLSNPSHRTPSKNVKVPVKKVLLTFGGGISKDFGIFWKWVEIEIERSDKIFSISFFPIFRLFCLDPIDSFWRIKKKLLLRLKTFGARTSKTGLTPIVHSGPYCKSVA